MSFIAEYARIGKLIDTAHERPTPEEAIEMLDQVVASATRASADIQRLFPKEAAALRLKQMENNHAN